MGIDALKSRLSTRQQNILTGVVTGIDDGYLNVRTSLGEIRRAVNSGSYALGDELELRDDGAALSVTGPAPLRPNTPLVTEV